MVKDRYFEIRTARNGSPYGYAFDESLIKSFKTEKIDLWQYRHVPFLIEEVYNRK
jgi:hypothetical protein